MPKLLNDRSIDPVDTNTTPSKIFSVKIPRTAITIPLDDWSDVAKSAINTLPKVWTRGLLYFIVLFTGIALPWAMFSQIDETGTGRGRLETKGTSNRLESATAGTVTAVRVREGQTVEQGQVLLELESDAVRTEIQHTKSKL